MLRNYNVFMKAQLLKKRRTEPKLKSSAKAVINGGVKAKLVRVGNSRGVRLPKSVIEQAGLTTDVEISVEHNCIIIQPAKKKKPRADWEQRFKKAIAKHGPPQPMDPDWEFMPNEFDEKEWTW
jgi:antitoxin MazE